MKEAVTANEKSCIVGLASIKDSLFVVRDPALQRIEVYSSSTFRSTGHIKVPGLANGSRVGGLTSCESMGCLFVSDYNSQTVYTVDVNARDKVSKIKVGLGPKGMSISNESAESCDLLVACTGNGTIEVYKALSSSCHLKTTVHLQSDVREPQHAVMLFNGHFAVSHPKPKDAVSVVDHQGRVVFSYSSSPPTGPLHCPRQLVVDQHGFILVADSMNHRIVVLNPILRSAHVLQLQWPDEERKSLVNPTRLCLDETRGRLFIGEFAGKRVWVCDKLDIVS